MSRVCIIFAACVIGFGAGSPGPVMAAGDGKSQELNRVLDDIKTVEQMVHQRTALAEDVRRKLTEQSDELKAEIQREQRRANVAAFPQARQIRRIDYNLRLVQQLLGYIDALDRRIGYFRSTALTLEFYRRRIRDDLLMLRALNDIETAELMRQLGRDLEQFKDQSGEPLLVASVVGLRPLEAIWSDMVPKEKPR